MSYDPAVATCSRCEKIVWLALDYEVRNGDEMHTECANEQDRDDGVCDNCDAPAVFRDGKPVFPTCHGSPVGLCQECARGIHQSMSHTQTAAKVAEHKKKRPELYCRYPNCLWRTVTDKGPNPCRKHGTFPERKEEPRK